MVHVFMENLSWYQSKFGIPQKIFMLLQNPMILHGAYQTTWLNISNLQISPGSMKERREEKV